MISEKQFLQMVKDLAHTLGWRVYHTFDSRRSDAGFPDLVLCKPPRIIFAELKSEKGKATGPQNRWLSELALCFNVEVYLWFPSDWDALVKILQSTANGDRD